MKNSGDTLKKTVDGKASAKNLLTLVALCGAVCILVLGIFFFATHRAVITKDDIGNEPLTISIAMAADDNYTYPTVVAITSIMENAQDTTKCEIYLMHPGNFSEENKGKILDLQDKYDNCAVTLINMEDRFRTANSKGHITTPTYYRLSLSSLLPELDRIIWLDGDTITTADLRGMYNLDMTDLCYRGFLDNNADGTKAFGVESDHYICAGVMLINLEELRRDNTEPKFIQFIEENNEKLAQHDQTVINVVCHEKIGVLPPQYGMMNVNDVVWYYQQLKESSRYTLQDMLDAYKDPVVLHLVTKPWKDKNAAFYGLWWDYAKLTSLYDEIANEYNGALK